MGVRALLEYVGEDPDREGIRDTPRRVVDAMLEMTQGAEVNVDKLLSVTFDSGNYDEIVAVRRIAFSSLCEHHLLPFTGRASVAYIPAGAPGKLRVVGLSKIPRLVDVYARRPQLQEQMTSQIADALEKYLKPRAVAVFVTAEHSCASCRGVRKSGMDMATSVLRGLFRDDPAARAEVLRLLAGGE
jgi:GTP cyclohydrolase I